MYRNLPISLDFFNKKSWNFVRNWFLLQCEILTQKEKAANNKLRDQN
jgi:hypothetical protein